MSYSWEKTLEKIRIARGVETEYVAGQTEEVSPKTLGKKSKKSSIEEAADPTVPTQEKKKSNTNKQKQNTIYKYSKKNTQFKKKK